MATDTCPVCGRPDSDDCACNPMLCPQCGQAVSWFGEEYGINPCEHFVAWGTVGEHTVWETESYESKFKKFWSKHAKEECFVTRESALPSFAASEELDYAKHSDGMGHGHSTGTYVLFLKKKPTQKAEVRKSG